MNPIVSLYRVTKELMDILEHPIPGGNRDELIIQITHLLEYRDTIIEDIKPPYNEEETKLGKEIVRMNTIIDSKIEDVKSNIQFDLSKLKKSKQNNTKYLKQYQSAPVDGIFFDKRK
ncbi:hypothetical protein [Fredinandcohnia onubensis]|uniref:hypothetical protein n=1 Tax=Fredinandcohnia onubensis TaxID=1571209 RepID=UPI000C0BBAF9|nr:hypothetical protein [Fredinandcohnia onubensis]